MSRERTTASGLLFENGIQIMDDLLDFTIERHADDIAAAEVYAGMRERMAQTRRHLRGALKKSWLKGRDRQRCLARARELREAELFIGLMVKAAEAAAEVNATVLENVKHLPGMKELLSGFTISVKGKRRNK